MVFENTKMNLAKEMKDLHSETTEEEIEDTN